MLKGDERVESFVNYPNFRRLSIVTTFAVALLGILLLRDVFLPVATGLILVWVEIGLTIASNVGALLLTRRAVSMKGIDIEENPGVRKMFRARKFTRIYLGYALMLLIGASLTLLTLLLGVITIAVPIVLLVVVVWFWLDLVNDVIYMGRIEKEEKASRSRSASTNL